MTADDPLGRLERLARLHDSGALSTEEFEREKALLLRAEESHAVPANENEVRPAAGGSHEARSDRNRRWPWMLLAGAILASGGGWTFANWAGNISSATPTAGAASSTDSQPLRPQSTPHAAPVGSTIRSLPEQRQVDLAFDAVFGQGEREIRVPEQAVYAYAKGKVAWARFGPILIVEGRGDPYPPALGTLGIFYLREVPGAKFEEVRRWPDEVTGSIMGNPPVWRVRNDITENLVIESTSGGVWQGYGCDSKTLTELAPNGPRALVTFDSHYDSSGAVEDGYQTFDGAIVNVVRNRSFDVRFTGTRTITQHYVRQGEAFVRVPAANEEMNESAIPTC